jgi:hypothetical protein
MKTAITNNTTILGDFNIDDGKHLILTMLIGTIFVI